MEKCLVTKLKSNVGDSNLPKLDTAYIDMEKEIGNLYGFYTCIIGVKEGYKSVVKLNADAYDPAFSDNLFREKIVTGGKNYMYAVINKNNVASHSKNLIEIDGIYGIRILALNCGGEHAILDGATLQNSLTSIYEYAPLEIVSINHEDLDVLAKNKHKVLKGAWIYYPSQTKIYDSPNAIINAFPSLEVISFAAPQTFPARINLPDWSNTNIKALLGAFIGDLLNVPNGLEQLMNYSTSLVGNIEDLVAKFRASGRTSGYLQIGDISLANSGIMYNGKSLMQHYKDGTFTKNIVYLTWTSDSLNITETKPSELGTNKFSQYSYWLEISEF